MHFPDRILCISTSFVDNKCKEWWVTGQPDLKQTPKWFECVFHISPGDVHPNITDIDTGQFTFAASASASTSALASTSPPVVIAVITVAAHD